MLRSLKKTKTKQKHLFKACTKHHVTSQVGVAGIELDQTKMEDSGNYSVEISGVNSAGVFFTLSGMAALQVGGS